MKTEQKAPEMTSRQHQFNTNSSRINKNNTRNNNNNNNNSNNNKSNNNSICNNNKNSNSTTIRTSYNENDIKTAVKKTHSQRICRRCMTQTIKPMTITTMTRNDCNYCKNKDHNSSSMNTWEEVLSINSKAKSDHTRSTTGESERKLSKNCDQINLLLFDPYHVLQFLIFELKTKLKVLLPDDKNVHKILSEIQQTMKRFETISTKTAAFTASNGTLVPEQENRVMKSNSSCQTDNNNYNLLHCENSSQTEYDDGDLIGFNAMNRLTMEAHIKQSHEKLKENCNTLEKACAVLQDEKYDIHDTLSKCYNEIAMLKTEILYLQTEMKQTTAKEKCTSQILEEQCKCLQDELKTLHEFLSRQTNELTIVENLNRKLKESSDKISSLQKSRLENDRTLILTKLEKEKLMILQNYRENQMNTLKKDMTEVCQIIQEQLDSLQKNDYNNDDNDILQSYPKVNDDNENENKNFPDISNNDRRRRRTTTTITTTLPSSLYRRKKSSIKILHKGKMFDKRSPSTKFTENSKTEFSKKSKISSSQNRQMLTKDESKVIEFTSSLSPSSADKGDRGNYERNLSKNFEKFNKNADKKNVDDDNDVEMNPYSTKDSRYKNKSDRNPRNSNKIHDFRSTFKSKRNQNPINVDDDDDDVIQSSKAKSLKKFSLNSSTDISFDPSHNDYEIEGG